MPKLLSMLQGCQDQKNDKGLPKWNQLVLKRTRYCKAAEDGQNGKNLYGDAPEHISKDPA